jgi:hypothetical protein
MQVLFAFSPTRGEGSRSVRLPDIPVLVGQIANLQAVLVPSAQPPLFVDFTNGLRCTLGY